MEIQAYYSYLVDLHISQIRPKLKNQSYIPHHFNQFVRIDTDFLEPYLDNKFSDFYHRWRETSEWKSQTQEIDFQRELEELEHEKHLLAEHDHHDSDDEHHGHGEIEWDDSKKFPHVATRLGYPILGCTPLEEIMGV